MNITTRDWTISDFGELSDIGESSNLVECFNIGELFDIGELSDIVGCFNPQQVVTNALLLAALSPTVWNFDGDNLPT